MACNHKCMECQNLIVRHNNDDLTWGSGYCFHNKNYENESWYKKRKCIIRGFSEKNCGNYRPRKAGLDLLEGGTKSERMYIWHNEDLVMPITKYELTTWG